MSHFVAKHPLSLGPPIPRWALALWTSFSLGLFCPASSGSQITLKPSLWVALGRHEAQHPDGQW